MEMADNIGENYPPRGTPDGEGYTQQLYIMRIEITSEYLQESILGILHIFFILYFYSLDE